MEFYRDEFQCKEFKATFKCIVNTLRQLRNHMNTSIDLKTYGQLQDIFHNIDSAIQDLRVQFHDTQYEKIRTLAGRLDVFNTCFVHRTINTITDDDIVSENETYGAFMECLFDGFEQHMWNFRKNNHLFL